MTRYYGKVGFVKTEQVEPGVWEPVTKTREYFGNVISNARRWSAKTDSTNDDLAVNNQISIVADDFAMKNMGAIKWAEFMGFKWKVSNINLAFPRLELSLSELYHDPDDSIESEDDFEGGACHASR